MEASMCVDLTSMASLALVKEGAVVLIRMQVVMVKIITR